MCINHFFCPRIFFATICAGMFFKTQFFDRTFRRDLSLMGDNKTLKTKRKNRPTESLPLNPSLSVDSEAGGQRGEQSRRSAFLSSPGAFGPAGRPFRYLAVARSCCSSWRTRRTNPYYSAPSKNKIFRNFFIILNIFAIVINLQKKNLIFVKTPKNNFLDPKLQTSIKPVGDIFDRRDPKHPH